MNNLECRRLKSRSRGFTIVEAVAIVIIALVLAVVLLPAMGRPRCGGRSIKDSTQVRGIHQGLVMFAQNNQDRYPLPSLLDKDGTTIAGDAAAKDTTANMMSILIYNGFFGPELCISSAESNALIKQMTNYFYSNPASAADPGKALWDPAFSADFTGGKTGNFSYAHAMPSGVRLGDWANTFDSNQAVVGNRGPQIASAARDSKGVLSPVMTIKNSNTLLIHGGRTTWEGNIAYNDNHVNFETRMISSRSKYSDPAHPTWEDCLFFDEPDDASGRNSFLGIYTKSGEAPGDFVTIWD